MKIKVLWFACWVFCASAACAEPPRMQLWITQSNAGLTDVSVCRPPTDSSAPPNISLLLTEHDVVAWSKQTGAWSLDAHRFPNTKAGWQLVDHCFVLAIDGKPISSGVVLWKHSARLTKIPTLLVSMRHHSLMLQLASGSKRPIELIHRDELAAVLHK
jgi:hypothetical protein